MHEGPRFRGTPGSRLAASVGPTWTLIPLRIPTGWAIRWNTILARMLPTGEIEANDSEDLLWAVKLPPPDTPVYSTEPTSPWREIHVDVGWYRDHFRIVMLDPDWDNVRRSYRTPELEELVLTLEDWLMQIGDHGDVRVAEQAGLAGRGQESRSKSR